MRTFCTSPAQSESLRSPPQEMGTKVHTSSSNRLGILTNLPSPCPASQGRELRAQAASGRTPGLHSTPPPTLPSLPVKSSLGFLPRTLLPGSSEAVPCARTQHTLLTVPPGFESHPCQGLVLRPWASHEPSLCYPILSGKQRDKTLPASRG